MLSTNLPESALLVLWGESTFNEPASPRMKRSSLSRQASWGGNWKTKFSFCETWTRLVIMRSFLPDSHEPIGPSWTLQFLESLLAAHQHLATVGIKKMKKGKTNFQNGRCGYFLDVSFTLFMVPGSRQWQEWSWCLQQGQPRSQSIAGRPPNPCIRSW